MIIYYFFNIVSNILIAISINMSKMKIAINKYSLSRKRTYNAKNITYDLTDLDIIFNPINNANNIFSKLNLATCIPEYF